MCIYVYFYNYDNSVDVYMCWFFQCGIYVISSVQQVHKLISFLYTLCGDKLNIFNKTIYSIGYADRDIVL